MPDTINQLSSSNPSRDTAPPAAIGRLEALGKVISSFDVARIGSHADITRMLCALDLANKCIHVVLKDVAGDGVRDRLIDESGRLMDLIAVARQKVEDLRVV